VRLVINRLTDGKLLRTLECGPSDGRRVLFAHGMLYPLLLIAGAAECDRLGIRLIMPVRSGYLDDQSAAALYDEIDATGDLDDIADFAAREPGGSMPVVGHSMGASWALRFARRHRARVETLVLLSPHFAGDQHRTSRFAPFLGGLKALTDRPGLFRYVAWQFRKYYVDTKLVERVLRKLFDGSADDLAVLDGEQGDGPVYDWFAASYRSSIVGIAQDMAAGMLGWQDELARLPCPTTIIYGPDDPVAMFARSSTSASFPRLVNLQPLRGGGHLVVASHPKEVWDVLLTVIGADK
jgi:pimeloyl-ACP methyl ester carboxylesterase